MAGGCGDEKKSLIVRYIQEFLPEDVFCVISFKRDHLTSGKSMLVVPWLGLMGRPHEIVTHYCCVDHGSECFEKSDAVLVDFVCIKFLMPFRA